MFYILYLFAVTLLSSSCVAFTASTGISHRHRGLMVHEMVNKNIINEINEMICESFKRAAPPPLSLRLFARAHFSFAYLRQLLVDIHV